MDIIQIISAAGMGGIVGSLLTTLVQGWLNYKSQIATRNFEEKKEAYIGFLNAIYKSEIEQTDEASLHAGHWINICEIIGSKNIQELLKRYKETNPINGSIHPERPEVMRKLKLTMKK